MTSPETDAGSTALAATLERVRTLRVRVIGDIMLDEYVAGHAERISPEAPVPVVRAGAIESRLGGAANVARQVVALGAHATLAGVLGTDASGDRILGLCAEAGIDTQPVSRDPARMSSRKLRVLARNHQMLRLDWEDTGACPPQVIAPIIESLRRDPAPDIVILSDYAKGVLSAATVAEIVSVCRERNVRVVVDPKQRDFGHYRGCSLLTPNLAELLAAAGESIDANDIDSIVRASRELIAAAELEAMVVTLGERGMLIVARDAAHTHLAASTPHPVADTTGAGDTVVATLAACLAAGATLVQAASIANIAAGIAVSRVGAVAVAAHEIEAAFGESRRDAAIGRKRLAAKVAAWRAAGDRIVFTNGCFDLLHAGHLTLLHHAADQGDRLVVAINGDASVRRLKGASRPIIGERERAALLAALGGVDAVTVFDEDTPLQLLEAIRPDVLVKGGDYRLQDVVGRELIESYGGRVVLVPLLPERSTSALIERISRQQGSD